MKITEISFLLEVAEVLLQEEHLQELLFIHAVQLVKIGTSHPSSGSKGERFIANGA